jgi:uncharacterized repeat protein (TIGR03806 family)
MQNNAALGWIEMHRYAALWVVGSVLLAAGCSRSSSGGGGPPPVDPAPPPLFGLDARPANASCLAPPLAADGEVEIALERVFESLPFNQPLGMLQAPGDDSRWFVLEKGGRVRVFQNLHDVQSFDPDFVSLGVNPVSEGGLLGMAFHPDYDTNGEVFLSWTEGPSGAMVSVVARFRTENGGLTLASGSRDDILTVNQDFNNHNGGQIEFGPDGYLYFGLGDGGSGGDPLNRAQDPTNLLGAMLRIDVDSVSPYAIPGGAAGNPFAGNPLCPADHSASQPCPEIFAFGLRNPWRWSFDRTTGRLWVADVGQNAREEINHVQLGGNYGWNCREGSIPYTSPGPDCGTATGLIDPVHDYPHSQGRSVTGGYVYRGAAIPALYGQYVFGDFVSGRIWRLIDDGAGGFTADELLASGRSIASFAEDLAGELYVVDLDGGIYRLVPSGSGGSSGRDPPVPERLSATGCVLAQNPSQPAAGLIPYSVAAPAWFDGAVHERWFAIPDGTTITIDQDGRFVFPVRAVLLEHLRRAGRLIETRLLMQHQVDSWAGYSYEWNEAGTEAVLVEGGAQREVDGGNWVFPSGGQCLACHRGGAGTTLGLATAQLNRDLLYAATGRTANQLATLSGVGLLSTPIGDPSVLPAFADPADSAAPFADRARAYLHVNCAHCHRGDGFAGGLDLRANTLLEQTGACGVAPQFGGLGIDQPQLIAPGEPDRSVLLARISRRDAHQMPPLATTVVDDAGVALIGGWIAALESCL